MKMVFIPYANVEVRRVIGLCTKMVIIPYANVEDLNKLAHPFSLIQVFSFGEYNIYIK